MEREISERLVMAEAKIEAHGKLHEETQDAIRMMADGIKQLAEGEIRREHDHETFKRIFLELERLNTDLKKLEAALENYRLVQVEKELEAYRTMVWKAIGLAALVFVSVVAGHFGIKLIGG